MGWEVINNRFFSNTTDEFFGPKLDTRVFFEGTDEQRYAFDAFSDFCKGKDPREYSDRELKEVVQDFEKKWLSGEISHNPADRKKKKKSPSRVGGNILTKAIAQDFLKERDWWNLFRFKSFEEGAAEILAEYDGEGLYLTGIKKLSIDDAQGLSKFGGTVVELNGLKRASEAVIAALSKFGGSWLLLDGLEELTDEAARHVVRFSGNILSLNGLKAVSDSVAVRLGKLATRQYMQSICLNSISQLSDSAAESFRKGKDVIELGGLRRLTIGSAIKLDKTSIVKQTKDEDAPALNAALKKCEEDCLNLENLKVLSTECARSISKFKGEGVDLSGLRTISTDAAENLVKFQGDEIVLIGLQNLSTAAAEALVKFNGSLLVELDLVSGAAGKILSKHPTLAE